MGIDIEDLVTLRTTPFERPALMVVHTPSAVGNSENFQLKMYTQILSDHECRYYVVPPTFKPKHQQPFWTKDWRRNGRKH